MTSEVLQVQEIEGEPTAWPAKPDGLSDWADAIPEAVVWQRIEQYINRRWPERSVEWFLVGRGEWVPRLFPVESIVAERWDGDSWVSVTLAASPRGWQLEGGEYKITANVGDDTATVPDKLTEAYRALAEYMAEVDPDGGATSIADGDFSITRSANAVARAIFYSGAADMLRVFKKVTR